MEDETGRKHVAWGWHIAAGVLTLGHFVWLMSHFVPAIHQPDANGYFAQATRLARDGRTWFEPQSHLQYINMHWLKTPSGRYYSHYPPGFAVVLAGPFREGGPAAAMTVNPLMASLTLLGLYLVCTVWVGPGWGLLAAALTAVNPSANQWALGYFAHTAVAFFLVWGLYFLARWERTFSWTWAACAGVFLGMLPSVRYPAALFCAAAAVFVVLTMLRHREAWRSAVVCAVAAAVPVFALLAYHQGAFGAFWRTGYSLTKEQTGFSWEWFTQHAVSYLEGLGGEGAGVLFGLGLAGIAVLCARRQTWRHGTLLALMVAPVTVLYMSYYWSGGGRAAGAMRFLVPTFFVYALAGVWLLSVLGESRRTAAVTAGLVLAAVAAAWGIPQSQQVLERSEGPARALVAITAVVEANVPPGSVLFAPEIVQQHLDFVGKWRLADVTAVRGGGGERFLARRLQRTDDDRPSPMQPEKLEERLRRYEGLEGIDRTRAFALDVWKWAGKDGKVYWLTDETQLNEFKGAIPWDWPDRFTTVAEIELPREEVPGRAGRRFAGMAGPPPGDLAAGLPPGPGAQDRPAARTFDRTRRRGPLAGGMGRMGSLLAGGKLLLVEWTAH